MKIRDELLAVFKEALRKLGIADRGVRIILEKPRLKEHGDIATPLALSLARSLKKNPLDIAESIAREASFPPELVSKVDVAEPGFINLKLSDSVLASNLMLILSEGSAYGSSSYGRNSNWQVEYISANPTGPLVVVSARAAAVGSVLVNLLNFSGYRAQGEYYVNDYGKQIEALGESLRYRIRERFSQLSDGEEIGAYPGEYLKEMARGLSEEKALDWLRSRSESAALEMGSYAAAEILKGIRSDLEAYGVGFDNFFHESSLHPDGISKTRALLEKSGHCYVSEGALYFRSSSLGDDKDRVLLKSNGEPTYFLGDIAYHLDKLERGFDGVIDIWGPDHHGHVKRMQAAAEVLGAPRGWLEVLIVGWVRLVEAGKPVGMSKRAGEFITMRELIEDVGSDVTKYFFLMRRTNSPLDFDLDLARKQSEENPVYYVQYAHARIASVIRFAVGRGVAGEKGREHLDLLSTPQERALMLHLLFFPNVVESATLSREPHRLTVYAQELATLFHQFYHDCRIVSDDEKLSGARLLMAEATMQVLKNVLKLLGVSAPESM